jgi:3-carboxy-cis,cis-muconate cycloisomerase
LCGIVDEPPLPGVASGAASHLAEIAKGLEVDPVRMRANLDATNGLIMGEAVQMALGEKLGRLEAHDLLERASATAASERRSLKEVLGEMPEVTAFLPASRLETLFNPLAYLGSADEFIERALNAAGRAVAVGGKRKR